MKFGPKMLIVRFQLRNLNTPAGTVNEAVAIKEEEPRSYHERSSGNHQLPGE
jgi:hypothetical protein